MAGARAIHDLDASAIAEQLDALRDRVMFCAGRRLGLRISELLALRVKHVANGRIPRAEIAIPRRCLKGGRAKGSKVSGRSLPICDELAALLADYLSCFQTKDLFPDAVLFPSRKGRNKPISSGQAWRILKKAAADAGLDTTRISTHTLRKSFARDVYDASGHDLHATQLLLGHRNISTTVQYLDADRDRLAALVRGLGAQNRSPVEVGEWGGESRLG